MHKKQITFTFAKRIELVWQKLGFLFAPLSLVYAIIVKCRAALYRNKIFRSYDAKIPIVSVGNLEVGGAGKTSFVLLLAHHLKRFNLSAAIFHSGYGNDESLMLAARHRHLVFASRKRHLSIKDAEAKADLIILDDGLQCLRLARDREIIVLDQTRLFTNEALLPWGRLRTSPYALRDAHYIVVNNCFHKNACEYFTNVVRAYSYAPLIFTKPYFRHLKNSDEEIIPMSLLRNFSWAVFCGLGNPAPFLMMLHQNRVSVGPTLIGLDHESPSTKKWHSLMETCEKNKINKLLCTEKDFFRIKNLSLPLEIYYLSSSLKIVEGKKCFEKLLSDVIKISTSQNMAS